MGLEIKDILTEGRISYYFGEADKFTGDNHKQAYIQACFFVMHSLRNLFSDKIEICNSSMSLNIDKFKKNNDNNYIIETTLFFHSIEDIFSSIYDSSDFEVVISSKDLVINIYSDPIDFQITYEKNSYKKVKKMNILHLIKSYLNQRGIGVSRYLKIP